MTTDTTSVTTLPAPRLPRRRSMFWPLVLIAVGLIALLGNYGIVQPVSFVSLLALWPVLLILLGIDIAFARRWPVPTLAAQVVIIGLALLLAATRPAALGLATFNFGTGGDCGDPSAATSIPRGSLQSLALRIDGGAARYHLSGGATGHAVEATADHDSICLRDRTSSGGTRGDVRLTQGGAHFGGSADISARVASDLPLSLHVNAGAGEFVFDLSDVKVIDVRLNIGASSTTIVLPHPTADISVRIEGGASSVVLEIPNDVEARIVVSGGLVSAGTTNPRTTKTGNIIETTGYAAAKDRVTVTVTGGATSVAVR